MQLQVIDASDRLEIIEFQFFLSSRSVSAVFLTAKAVFLVELGKLRSLEFQLSKLTLISAAEMMLRYIPQQESFQSSQLTLISATQSARCCSGKCSSSFQSSPLTLISATQAVLREGRGVLLQGVSVESADPH